MAKVSFIIVNWNGRELLDGCLQSICQQQGDYEIILVDNGSSDDSVKYVRELYPMVIVVALNENNGFAGGNIAGYAQASGQYIALVNTDVILRDGWLKAILSAMERNPSVGICSSLLIKSSSGKIDSAGDYFTTAFNVCRPGEDCSPQDFNSECIIPGACAAAVLYRRRMLETIGFFDEDFFLNHEDTDLNLRALVTGWQCLLVPDAVAVHAVSASIGVLSDTAVFYMARNSLWVWIKNVPSRLLVTLFFHRLFYEIAAAVLFCVVHRKWKPYLKGKYVSIIKFPDMFRKRKETQRLVKISTDEIRRALRPLGGYFIDRLSFVKDHQLLL